MLYTLTLHDHETDELAFSVTGATAAEATANLLLAISKQAGEQADELLPLITEGLVELYEAMFEDNERPWRASMPQMDGSGFDLTLTEEEPAPCKIRICSNAETLASGRDLGPELTDAEVAQVASSAACTLAYELLPNAQVGVDSFFRNWNGGTYDQHWKRIGFVAIPQDADATLQAAAVPINDLINGILDANEEGPETDPELLPDPAHDVTGNGNESHYDLARQLEMRGYDVQPDPYDVHRSEVFYDGHHLADITGDDPARVVNCGLSPKDVQLLTQAATQIAGSIFEITASDHIEDRLQQARKWRNLGTDSDLTGQDRIALDLLYDAATGISSDLVDAETNDVIRDATLAEACESATAVNGIIEVDGRRVYVAQ